MSVRSPEQVPQQKKRASGSRRNLLLLAGLIIVFILGGVAWWLLSPLFLHNTAADTNVLAIPSPIATSAQNGTPTVGATTVPTGPVILATGAFIDKKNSGVGLANDRGSGNVTIGKTAAGSYILRLEQLDVTNGPDLHVYLAAEANPTQPEQVKSGIDLGTLKATEGSVNVPITAEIGQKLRQYRSVVIYCKTFSVIFTVAPLAYH